MTALRKRRARHAASRARKITAALSVFAFVAIGRAIDVASGTTTTTQTGAVAQRAASPASSSGSNRSATVSAGAGTTTAVTSTHAS